MAKKQARRSPEPALAKSPWSDDQVASLAAYQKEGSFHPFTGVNSKGEKVDLIPTPAGWIAEEGGEVCQDWAHAWMANWQWVSQWIIFRKDRSARWRSAYECNPQRD